jgi:hypothetical protein
LKGRSVSWTRWSFQSLCNPPLIRSFIMSYLLATDEKTCPTRDCF